jgi:hypothetical protein
MSFIKERILDPQLIPPSLWDPETDTLHIPRPLADAYVGLINQLGLQQLASARDPKNPPVGGMTQEKTDQHFAQAFDGSVARAQLALLDPKSNATAASNAYLGVLAGNTLCLTDAPCGAGAAAFSFLANIAQLRAEGVLPRLPLDVFLIGAELSEPARIHAQALLDELLQKFEEQAIFVSYEFVSWNVTSALSNTDLIQRMTLNSARTSHRLLVVANFNGFLEKERKRKEAEPQIEELFRHASGANSVAVWIEPDMNRATADGGLFSWLRSFADRWKSFFRELSSSNEPIPTSSAFFQLPSAPEEKAAVRLAVMPISLERGQ